MYYLDNMHHLERLVFIAFDQCFARTLAVNLTNIEGTVPTLVAFFI